MKNLTIFIPTIIMAILSLFAFLMAYNKGEHIQGLIISKNLIIQVLPILVFALFLAGMIQVLIPADLIAKWIGKESGLKGIMIGAFVGAFIPGGPFVGMPIILGFLKVGAAIPVLVAMLTGWSLIGINRLPIEIGVLGPKLTLIRLASVIIFAPLAGLVAKLMMSIFKIR